MFNFDYMTKKYIKECNPKWPEIPDHSYRILIKYQILIKFIYTLKIHFKQNINF